MQLSTKERVGVFEIILSQKLTIENSDEFESFFNEKALRTGKKYIALNFDEISFIDSSGMGSLLKILNTCKENNKELILHSINDKVHQIFKLARLGKYFNIMEYKNFNQTYPVDA